jgi:hypothetical protein
MSLIELTSYNLMPYNIPSYVQYVYDYAESVSVSDSDSVTEYDSDIEYQTVIDLQDYYSQRLGSFLEITVDDLDSSFDDDTDDEMYTNNENIFDDIIYDDCSECSESRIVLQ